MIWLGQINLTATEAGLAEQMTTTTTNMSPADLIKTATYASQQSDRWLFIAMLIIFLLAIGAITRWGMQELAKRDLKIAELSKEINGLWQNHSERAIEHSEKLAELVTSNSQVIANNSMALGHNTEIFGRIKGALELIKQTPALKGHPES